MNSCNLFQLFLILFFSLLWVGCEKEPDPPAQPWPFWGFTTAERNGEPWSSEIFAKHILNLNDNLYISMDSLLGLNLETQIESFGFTRVKKKVGINRLTTQDSLAGDSLAIAKLYIVDWDVIIGHYKVIDNDPDSYLEIESIDTMSKIIKGRFGATMVVTKRPFPFYPDTIRYRNGRFETKIIN